MAELQSYLATIESPMRRAKAEAALNVTVRLNGGDLYRRHVIVEMRIAEGGYVTETKHSGAVLMAKDGSFFDTANITKSGLDYARYLTQGESP